MRCLRKLTVDTGLPGTTDRHLLKCGFLRIKKFLSYKPAEMTDTAVSTSKLRTCNHVPPVDIRLGVKEDGVPK
jgi:hypothetical protein